MAVLVFSQSCSASLWTSPSPTWRFPLLPLYYWCGRIGSKLALYLRSLDFQVCIYDPYIESGFEKVLNCVRVNFAGTIGAPILFQLMSSY